MNRKWIVLVVMLCATNLRSTEAQGCSSYTQKMCDDGECIDLELFCDGTKNCKDGSDETGERCLAVECPKFSWKCTYGACINPEAKCNKVQDCVDNSDENARMCKYPAPNRITGDGKFKCDSGMLISADDTCDGVKDCDDGSDETTEQCTDLQCPDWGFRCAYGGCIGKHLKCNGIKNCADGSDEYPTICDSTAPIIPTRPTTATTTTTTTERSMTENGCMIPSSPNILAFWIGEGNVTLKPGTFVDEFTTINYECRPKFLLEGVLTNFCVGGQWVSPEPVCNRYCSSVHLKGVTFLANCEFNRISIPCNQPLKHGTIARISCQVGYRKPEDRVVQDILRCDEFGEWDYSPFRCEPICGIEKADGVPFVLGGETVNITSVPWHAAIFLNQRNKIENICGGTIINAKVVVSAAHCFWSNQLQSVINHTYIMVGVGKYYRDIFAKEPQNAQYLNVSEILLPQGYQDVQLAYQNDIALLVLSQNIQFMSEVRPICLEWFDYSQKYVKSGITGRLAGWGKTGPQLMPSNELRMVELPTVSYDDCRNAVAPRFRTALAGDKFCLASVNGEAACEGDSGGGFVVPKVINGVNTYFLWGIVSNALIDRGQCTNTFHTAFTNIQFHQAMIMEYESRFRPK